MERGDLVDVRQRVRALHDFRASEQFESLVIASRRVANILRGMSYPEEVRPELFREPEEEDLYRTYLEVAERARPLLEGEDYGAALSLFVKMRPIIDRFFDEVLVMEEDEALRNNRLALLGSIWRLFREVADISRLSV